MNAIPQRQPQDQKSVRPATELLADAMTQQAAILSEYEARAARIEEARSCGANEFVFTWQTDDARDADLLVYYKTHGEADLVATELVSIDFRAPTSQEQMRYELQFEAELHRGGELWDRVASRIWERSS